MFDPIAVTSPAQAVSFVLTWLRDLSIFGVVLMFGWKSRDLWQDVKDFANAVRAHMKKMEGFALRVENNHMRHMERYLYQMAKDRNITSVVDPDLIAQVTEPVEPPEEDEHDASPF